MEVLKNNGDAREPAQASFQFKCFHLDLMGNFTGEKHHMHQVLFNELENKLQ